MSVNPNMKGNCPYNEGVNCEYQKCEKGGACGWHPMIQVYRKNKIKKNELKMMPLPDPLPTPEPREEKTRPPRSRHGYSAERIEKLRAEGRCAICGKPTDRPDKWCCSACYERKRMQEKAKKALFDGI